MKSGLDWGVVITCPGLSAGEDYEVWVTWPGDVSNAADDAPFTVTHGTTSQTFSEHLRIQTHR